MKHGPRCPSCHFNMRVEREEGQDMYVCPECGHAESIERVSDVLTVRMPEPFNPKALFDKMRKALE